jgi:hypothetical protein
METTTAPSSGNQSPTSADSVPSAGGQQPATPPLQPPPEPANTLAAVEIQQPNGVNMFAIEKWITQAVSGEEEKLLSNKFKLNKEDVRICPSNMRVGSVYDWSVECLEPGFLEGGDTIQGVETVAARDDGTLVPKLVVLTVKREALKQRADKRPIPVKVRVKHLGNVLREETLTFVFIGRQRVPQTELDCPNCEGSGKKGSAEQDCGSCGGFGKTGSPWQFVALVNPEAEPIKKAREGYVQAERSLPEGLEEELKRRFAKELAAPIDSKEVAETTQFAMKFIKVFLMFREIDRYQLKYQNLTAGRDGGRYSQECRTISEVISSKSGNCVELTIVLLSLFEAVGADGYGAVFDPHILCPEGHAIAGAGGDGGMIYIESTRMSWSSQKAREAYSKIRKQQSIVRGIEAALRAVGRDALLNDKSWPRYWACIDKGFLHDPVLRTVSIAEWRRSGVISLDSTK